MFFRRTCRYEDVSCEVVESGVEQVEGGVLVHDGVHAHCRQDQTYHDRVVVLTGALTPVLQTLTSQEEENVEEVEGELETGDAAAAVAIAGLRRTKQVQQRILRTERVSFLGAPSGLQNRPR